MKIRLFISILLSLFLTSCVLPQGASDCLKKENSALCFSLNENGQGIAYEFSSGNQVKLSIVNEKTYLISPFGKRYHVVNTQVFNKISESDKTQYYNVTISFSDDQGHDLTHIESGHWQVFLTYKLSDGIEHDASMDFNVTQSLYVPFIMRPN